MRRARAYLIRFRRELSAVCAATAMLLVGTQLHPLGASQVWVAAHRIPAGATLTTSDLALADSTLTWQSLIDTEDDVVGRTAAFAIDAGEPLTTRSVVAPSVLTLAGRVAVTVEVSHADAALVARGDSIDVLSSDPEGQAITAATRATVIAVPSTGVVVVAVLASEAVRIAAARANATYTLVLRPPD